MRKAAGQGTADHRSGDNYRMFNPFMDLPSIKVANCCQLHCKLQDSLMSKGTSSKTLEQGKQIFVEVATPRQILKDTISLSQKLDTITRRYGLLRGPSSSSCGGLWPLAKAFISILALILVIFSDQ